MRRNQWLQRSRALPLESPEPDEFERHRAKGLVARRPKRLCEHSREMRTVEPIQPGPPQRAARPGSRTPGTSRAWFLRDEAATVEDVGAMTDSPGADERRAVRTGLVVNEKPTRR